MREHVLEPTAQSDLVSDMSFGRRARELDVEGLPGQIPETYVTANHRDRPQKRLNPWLYARGSLVAVRLVGAPTPLRCDLHLRMPRKPCITRSHSRG